MYDLETIARDAEAGIASLPSSERTDLASWYVHASLDAAIAERGAA